MPSPGCDVAFTYVEWISPVIITCEHISAHAEAAAAMAHEIFAIFVECTSASKTKHMSTISYHTFHL